MIIRAADGQAGVLAKLAARLWEDSAVPGLTEMFRDLTNRRDAACFIAYSDGEPVGFAQCQLRHDYVEGTETSPVGYLEGIFVCEDFRRQGWGRRLLDECEGWARAEGCTEFASDCELDNRDSLGFHLKTGFTEANRVICFTKKL